MALIVVCAFFFEKKRNYQSRETKKNINTDLITGHKRTCLASAIFFS